MAQTCRQLHPMCDEPVLWRRLFCFRWGKKGRQQNNLSWKARYMERDMLELTAAGGGIEAHRQPADAMQEMFVQAHIAKRQQAIPKAAIDDLMLVEDDEVAARVLAWRKSRGFHQGSGAAPVLTTQRPADLMLHPAPMGGEKIVEPSSGLLVCPISGAVSDRMMTRAEEAQEEERCAEEGGQAALDEDYGGERGRLARAFAAGYYCSNERELMRKCGVRLSR
eukprot:gene13521-13646_t